MDHNEAFEWPAGQPPEQGLARRTEFLWPETATADATSLTPAIEHRPINVLVVLGSRRDETVGDRSVDQVIEPGGRRLSRLTTETFSAPNLDELARRVRESQAQGVSDPSNPSEQLWVDQNGDIRMGNVDDESRMSKLTQETFAVTAGLRFAEEQAIVARKLPAGTQYASDGNYDGWLYETVNEFGDWYELFLWLDPASNRYQVSLVSPRMEGTVDGHGCHLYTDGTLCLKTGANGYESLERAYARSLLWIRGASCYRRGHGFQFNVGQGA